MGENKKLSLDWSAIEKALAEGTYSGYKMGVIETEKLFREFLENKKIPGGTTEAKIKYVAKFLSRAEQLKYSIQIYQKIMDQPSFEITRDETKQAIGGFWQAMLDLEEAIVTLSASQKLKLRFDLFRERLIKKIKTIAAVLAGLILLVLFFNDTAIGKRASISIGSNIHYLVFTAGPWILGGFIALFLLWLGWKMIGKRGREF